MPKNSKLSFGLLSVSFNATFFSAIFFFNLATIISRLFSKAILMTLFLVSGIMKVEMGRDNLCGIDLNFVILLNLEIDFSRFPSDKLNHIELLLILIELRPM